jgi:UDP-N-acetylglucosamine--N-acetylmuramyl-(pentapeptide) pyrophosphoryl-undecaprenol N-acetylglucosamine transferase
MKIIIAGGGTGGHLFPAVAVGEEIMRERTDTEVLFVGTSAGLEAKWLPKSGHRYELFPVHGIRGHGVLGRVRAALEFLRAIGMARALVARVRPDVIVGAGGYASAPIGVTAILARIPLVLMEQNTLPGLSNKILWRFANRICVGFNDAAGYFSGAKVEVTGNPVRFEYRSGPRSGNPGQTQILVLGGSTGAHRLNIGVLSAFKIYGKSVINLNVVHQTGEADEVLVRQGYKELPVRAEVVAFIDDMPSALEAADLVIARGGAMTVTDIALAARPAIFVPYPFHKDMQQLHNARVLEEIGGAKIVLDDDRVGENLARAMETMLADRAQLIEIGQRAHQAAHPDAARRIARVCFEVAGAGQGA